VTPRKSPANQTAGKVLPGNQYRGVHGKVVDWAEHTFEEGGLLFPSRDIPRNLGPTLLPPWSDSVWYPLAVGSRRSACETILSRTASF
jgi:hypothetical protein